MKIKKPERYIHLIAVRITDRQMKKLQREAESADVSIGEVVRQCVDLLKE